MVESDDRTLIERLYRAGDPPGTPLPGLVIARNIVAAIVVAVVVVEFVVWLAVGLGTGHLGSPWWLWSASGGAVVVGALSAWAWASPRPGGPAAPGHANEPPADKGQPTSSTGRTRRGSWSLTWSRAYRVALAVFVISSAAQFVVWLVLGLTSGHFDSPWWAWSVLPLAVVVLAVRVLARDEVRRARDGQA